MFGWWAEGGNASSFVWITVGAEKLSFHWFDQPRLAKNLSMGQQLTMLFSHRSFLVKSVKIDQRGELARSVGNRGVTWVITQRDLSLWATRLLLNKSDKVKQTWLQVFWFCWTNAKTHAKQKLWNSLTKKDHHRSFSGWALPGDFGALSYCKIPISEIIWIFRPLDHSCKKNSFSGNLLLCFMTIGIVVLCAPCM